MDSIACIYFYGISRARHAEIDRTPTREELDAASAAARDAGLWRFDLRA